MESEDTITKVFKNEKYQSVFEIGCQEGFFLPQYCEVGGIDFDEVAIAAARERFPQYADNFIIRNLYQTPWPIPDKKYDLVISLGTLLLVQYPHLIIKEMQRIGKKVIIAEIHETSGDEFGLYPPLLRISRDYTKFGFIVKDEYVDKTILKLTN